MPFRKLETILKCYLSTKLLNKNIYHLSKYKISTFLMKLHTNCFALSKISKFRSPTTLFMADYFTFVSSHSLRKNDKITLNRKPPGIHLDKIPRAKIFHVFPHLCSYFNEVKFIVLLSSLFPNFQHETFTFSITTLYFPK